MRTLVGCRRGWLHSGGRVKIGPTTRLAANAGLRVGAVTGSLVVTDIALFAGCDSLDTSGAVDNALRKPKDDDDRVDDEVSWQHEKVSSGYTAGRATFWYKDHDTFEARSGGKMAEVAE